VYTAFAVLAVIALAVQALILFLAFFGPDLPYEVIDPPDHPLDSCEFSELLATLTDAQLHSGNRIEVLTNGPCFYQAELDAIANARETINLEAYIFHKGEIGAKFRDALTERARAGVKVKLIVDFIGSFSVRKSWFRELVEAGGRVEWYHSLRLDLIPQINNRTHRELMVVDGEIGFIGGAGIDDHWYKSSNGDARWRDTVCRVTGPAVTSLQSVFAENWLRVSGEILASGDYFHDGATQTGSFHDGPARAGSVAMIVNSTPAAGSTRARILFQMLIACGRKRVYITTPYFLPDQSARKAVREAIEKRGVDVRILTPGAHSDHMLTRGSSERLYGPLLKAGARIYEYQPAMIHAKVLIADDVWSVVGSTNFDHRSFELNDEVNMAVCDAAVATRLRQDFENDLRQSREITYDEWRKQRKYRVYEWLGALIAKQE
jgi:cardiolipin synthase